MSKTITIDAETILVQLKRSDAEAIFKTIDSQREYLGKWLPFVAFTQALPDTEKFVESVVDVPEERFEYIFTIRRKNKFIGLVGFKDTDKLNRRTEIGYWISEKFQKQGIVTKSVKLLCGFAFGELGMNRIAIKCAVKNEASKNIPKRLGFTFEGIERDGEFVIDDTFRDIEVFSKLKSDPG